jgi:hypothetical protein
VSVAQAVDLSAWQVVQGLGILYLSVMAGVMKAKVWALTFTSAMVVSIFGMWQAMQLLPADPFRDAEGEIQEKLRAEEKNINAQLNRS